MPRCKSANPLLNPQLNCRAVPFLSGTQEVAGLLFANSESIKVIIYCGGRRSNVSKSCLTAAKILELGVSVFVFEYRGYGSSKGHASLKSGVRDIQAAYNAVRQQGFAPEDIILYGESLGAAMAVAVSTECLVSGLIMQSGFASLSAQVKQMLPLLKLYPDCAFPKPRLASDATLRQGHPPLLILHGDQDGVIGTGHAHRLHTAGGANTQLAILSGAGHLNVQIHPEWKRVVGGFIRSL